MINWKKAAKSYRAKFKDAAYEAWDNWMWDFSEGLERFGRDWDDLSGGTLPVSVPHGTRMAEHYCILLKQLDEARAQIKELEQRCSDYAALLALPVVFREPQ